MWPAAKSYILRYRALPTHASKKSSGEGPPVLKVLSMPTLLCEKAPTNGHPQGSLFAKQRPLGLVSCCLIGPIYNNCMF